MYFTTYAVNTATDLTRPALQQPAAAGRVFLLLVFGGSLFFYFLPAIVAGSRHHRNGAAIFCLNLFLGWSLIGWVVALCWALTNQQPPTYSVAVAGGSLPPAAPQLPK